MSARRFRGVPTADDDAISLAMSLVAVPTVLGVLGWWLDGLTGTGPALLLAFAAFGVACSFAGAYYRYESKIARHETGKPWTRSRAS
ncbi:MAG TPA: AtpZ/AtpI family protein [Acidimicrobiia bacterium]|nr:AtpZ/AtpI family protein [Acidimicrobiia bacterium]